MPGHTPDLDPDVHIADRTLAAVRNGNLGQFVRTTKPLDLNLRDIGDLAPLQLACLLLVRPALLYVRSDSPGSQAHGPEREERSRVGRNFRTEQAAQPEDASYDAKCGHGGHDLPESGCLEGSGHSGPM